MVQTIITDRNEQPYSTNNRLPVDANLSVADIQIGAVEIKNATTDDRTIVDTNGNLSVINFAQLVPKEYDYIALTYVTVGNGIGEVETVTYKTGGAVGTNVAVLTLTYDTNNNVSTITRV